MRLLLDTMIVQILTIEPARLTRAETAVLASARNTFTISAVSLWEMRLKWQTSYRSGDRKGKADPEQVVAVLAKIGFAYDALPLAFAHCIAVLATPLASTESFDRLLLAQAQVEGLRLYTRDGQLEHHPLALFA